METQQLDVFIYLHEQDATQGQFVSLTGLNSEFLFSQTSCHIKVKEYRLPYYLPIVGRNIVGMHTFP